MTPSTFLRSILGVPLLSCPDEHFTGLPDSSAAAVSHEEGQLLYIKCSACGARHIVKAKI